MEVFPSSFLARTHTTPNLPSGRGRTYSNASPPNPMTGHQANASTGHISTYSQPSSLRSQHGRLVHYDLSTLQLRLRSEISSDTTGIILSPLISPVLTTLVFSPWPLSLSDQSPARRPHHCLFPQGKEPKVCSCFLQRSYDAISMRLWFQLPAWFIHI